MNIGNGPIHLWKDGGKGAPIAQYVEWIAVRDDAGELAAVIVPNDVEIPDSDCFDYFIGSNNVRCRVFGVSPEAYGLRRLQLGPRREVMN